jgi:multidrug efflux system membrane fusion protein
MPRASAKSNRRQPCIKTVKLEGGKTLMNRRWVFLLLVSSLVCAAQSGCQPAQSRPTAPNPIAAYEAPITRVVKEIEELPGHTDAIVKVQVRARVTGYMTNVYFKDGTYVEKDSKLFEIDPRPFMADRDRARGTVQQLEAHLSRLEREYNRAKNLMSRGSISAEEHDRYESDYRESLANLEVAKANLQLAELNVEWTEVRSPCSGLLSRRMVDPGNLVKADDTMLTSIVSLDPLYVYFDPADSTMLKIRRLIQERKAKNESEHDVPVRVFLADEDATKDAAHEGTVDFTDNQGDINTGTVAFRAKLRNPDHFIAPGLFVRVRLPIGDDHRAIMVREQALERDQDRKRVWLLYNDLLVATPSELGQIPARGKNLVVVAAVKNVLYFRIFDGDGKMVVDIDEARLPKQARLISDLKKRFTEKELWPPHKLVDSEKATIITAVENIVGHTASVRRNDIAATGVAEKGPFGMGPAVQATVKGKDGAAEPEPKFIVMPRYVTTGVARDGLLEVKQGIEGDELVVVEGMQRLRPGIQVDHKPAALGTQNPEPAAAAGKAEPGRRANQAAGAPLPANNNPNAARVNAPQLPESGNRLGSARRGEKIAPRSPETAATRPREPRSSAFGPPPSP